MRFSSFLKPTFLSLAIATIFINSSFSQNQSLYGCEGKEVPYKAFIKGFENADSITIADIIKSGKLESANEAFEVESYTIAFGGSDVGGEGLYSEMHVEKNELSDYNIKILSRLTKIKTIYFDCIKAKNKIGEIYLLKSFSCKTIQKK